MDSSPRTIREQIMPQAAALAKIAVEEQFRLQPQVWKMDPESEIVAKSIRDAAYHFTYLAESLAVDDPLLFLDYIAWAKILFHHLNLPGDMLPVTLTCMKHALQQILPAQTAEIASQPIDLALRQYPELPDQQETFFSHSLPATPLAQAYLSALLDGDRRSATQMILDAVHQHQIDIPSLYLDVFQPTQKEIGRLWQMNQISVAQEHFCTVVTQSIISQLYPIIFSVGKSEQRVIATAVGGELHELGMRMVADLLEMNGWDTYYLGANTPQESVLAAIRERNAHIVAISATISFHVSKVRDLIGMIHTAPDLPDVKIMVGGYPFNLSPNLWREVGADGYAKDARSAVETARQLLEGKPE